jgi:hypothetical protein
VIQVVSSVLIPPHGGEGHETSYVDGDEITVDELMERLEPFLEKEDKTFIGEL